MGTIHTPHGDLGEPVDVWLAFDHEDDEEASHEANTYMTDTGYCVEWYNNAVGLVTHEEFDTLADAYDWLEANGYQNFTS